MLFTRSRQALSFPPWKSAGDKKSKKREARDERYGFGGRKRLKKQNDATSAADMEGCVA